jgi:hypothetical protein
MQLCRQAPDHIHWWWHDLIWHTMVSTISPGFYPQHVHLWLVSLLIAITVLMPPPPPRPNYLEHYLGSVDPNPSGILGSVIIFSEAPVWLLWRWWWHWSLHRKESCLNWNARWGEYFWQNGLNFLILHQRWYLGSLALPLLVSPFCI